MPVNPHKDKKGRRRWRFSFNRVIKGERTRATKLLPAGWSRASAETYDRDETARLYAIAAGTERPEPTIGAAVALYITHRVPQLRNKLKVIRDLALLFPYIDGRPISDLPEVALEYATENPDLAPATVRNRLSYLKAACRYAWKKHNLTEHDPTGRMELPRVSNATIVDIPVERTERLLRRIRNLKARALFTLAFYCGCRWIAEIHPRQPKDVIKHGRQVEIHVGTTKNGRPLLVPVHPKARWALAYLPFDEWGWRWYYERFVEARLAEGLGGMWVHHMRHVLGADVVRRTGNQRDAMEALHHRSIQSSLRYTVFDNERLKRVLFEVGASKKMHTRGRRRRARAAA